MRNKYSRFGGQVFLAGLLLASLLLAATTVLGQDKQIDTFRSKQLTDVYYSEGAGAGDLDADGDVDLVYGPYWFEGPDFETKHEIYPPKPQNVNFYADHFFAWVHDFDGDKYGDIFVVGFPGTPAYVYQNPGKGKGEGAAGHWKKHQVFDSVSNESPHFINLVGDEKPELICTRDGYFGYATIDWTKPFEAWTFHVVSPQIADKKFGHGLGVGDVNSDGRIDIVFPGGWLEQPADPDKTPRWTLHEVQFGNKYGGAEMYVYDVDGDGDNDVITSIAAHDFGLSWFENVGTKAEPKFEEHVILGEKASQNRYGLVFTELHSVALADIDGDGLKDIITGKTYWSHHRSSPMWDAGAVVYWFRLQRNKDGVDWVPYLADGDSGIGRQITVHDVNGDKLPDLVVGGMKGSHVLLHERKKVDEAEWKKHQPKRVESVPAPGASGKRGDLFEGETLKITKLTAGNAGEQGMDGFTKDKWSNNSQLWWTGGKPGARLELEFPVAEEGEYDLALALTKAVDYGIVKIDVDGNVLAEKIDCFNDPEVITTGRLTYPKQKLSAGKHKLGFEIVGANDKAVKGYMVGIDYLQLGTMDGELPKSADGKALNLDFEKGNLDDWKAEGTAFAGQPIRGDTVSKRRNDMKSGHQGEFWIGGYEPRGNNPGGDQPIGTLTSAPFVVTHPYAAFLFAGGDHENIRVEVVHSDSGKIIYKTSGQNVENLRQHVVDLKPYANQAIYIRLVDQVSGGWGHVNFDNFRFFSSQPGPITPAVQQLVLDEYPLGNVPAEEAAKAMKLPPGFTVVVAANEPEIKQPIAMALDDRGRLWVAEAYEYPIRAKGDKGRDRILIFEDVDGDGKFDKKKVFAEGLNLISGLEVGFGGVWVGAAPYLMFIADANGDDVPDGEPKILLDGWAYQDTHETLNTFIWGPDGWLYGCHGVFTHSNVGKPGASKEERQPINAGIWRYHPTRHTFEIFAHGTSNPWGVDFNDRGQAFETACVIPHLFHMIQGARYNRQAGNHFNPFTYADIETIADHRHYLGANPHGGNNKSDAAGGGHAHSGAMIYLGGTWPKGYRDQIFMNNIHGQRLNVDILKPEGSGYVGSHGPDFLLTGDRASQILNFRYGPDGNVWMIDWYDMQACHTGNPDNHDRTNGRVYKIAYGAGEGSGAKTAPVDLSKLNDLQLAELVLHNNDWYVRHARKVLQHRAATGKIDPKATEALAKIAVSHEDETRRLRALWALHVTGGLTSELTDRLLADTSPYVRGWTIQTSFELGAEKLTEARLNQLVTMAKNDPSPVVRLYLASAAQKVAPANRWSLVEALTAHREDASDHNLPLMYWYAAEPLAEVDGRRSIALALRAGEGIPMLRDFMLRRIGSGDGSASLSLLLEGLKDANSADAQQTFLDALLAGVRGRRRIAAPTGWKTAYTKLSQSSDPAVRGKADALGVAFGDPEALKLMRNIAASAQGETVNRRRAIEALLAAKDPDLPGVLLALLDHSELRAIALSGLAQYSAPQTADRIIAAYPQLNAEEKRLALATLSARAKTAAAMLVAVSDKKIPSTDLSADLARQLSFLKDKEVDELLSKTWGAVRETSADKVKQIAEYKKLVQDSASPDADVMLGRTLFAKTCQRCHTLYGKGAKIGPDLTGSNRRDIDYLLTNIVDPSAVMAKEYQTSVVELEDGRVVTGILKNEDAKSVTVQTAEALLVIPKDEISERELSPQSMMPEDQLRQFSHQELRSLVAYLRDSRQAPFLATAENATTLFDGKSLKGWSGEDGLWRVENGEIIGSAPRGLKENEFLISDLAAGDFHLTVEVLLKNNEGNSGIQFRSTPHEHGVRGYQADVGVGWWGKLYEEDGRGLLWDRSGEQHVKPGQWNTYEVIASGSKIQTKINGQLCVDLDDPKGEKRGVFALQLHSGGPTEVRFRNFKLEVK